MVARITFRSEIYIEGEDIKEIRDRFERIPIYDVKLDGDKESEYGFCEIMSVEDAETNEDMETEFYHAYDNIKGE